MKSTLLTVGFGILAITGQVNAALTLDGQRIGLDIEYPNQGTLYASYGTADVVTPGIEFDTSGTVFTLDISATQVVFAYRATFTALSAPWNAYRISDVNNAFKFTSASVNSASNLVGLTPDRITFDTHNLYINVQGLNINPTTVAILDVGIAPIPEPSNYVAGISALAMLYFGWRNRK